MKCNTCGKMNCYAHGGSIYDEDQEKGVHPRSYSKQGGGISDAGNVLRDTAGMKKGGKFDRTEDVKNEHRRVLGESRAMPNPKLKGLAEGGVAGEDGEPMDDMAGVDDELMDMACQELIDALHSKNKKEVLESLKAIILSCKE